MGEIKSTLDIVMEKTKHLTLTDEERTAQKKDEMTNKVRGLIQRCLDGSIDVFRMKKEIAAFPGENRDEAIDLLIELCIKGFDFMKDKGLLIQILEEVAQLNPDPFMEVLSSFEDEIQKGYGKAKARLFQVLKEKGISGSAVVPNVDADQEWQKELSRLQNKFRDTVSSVLKSPSSGT
jgi:hypothetical protein